MQCDNDSMTEEVTTSGLQPLQELVGGANSGGDSDCGVGAASTAAAPTMPHFGTNATEATSSELVNAWQQLAHPEFISLQQVLEAVTVLQSHFMGRPELGTTVQEQQQQKQNIDRSQSSTTPEQQLLLQKLLIHTCHLLEQENNVATTLTPQTPLRDATTMPPSPPQPLNRVPLLRSIRLLLLQCIDSTWSPNALLTLSIDQTAPTNMPDYKSSSSSTDVQSDDLSGASEHPNKSDLIDLLLTVWKSENSSGGHHDATSMATIASILRLFHCMIRSHKQKLNVNKPPNRRHDENRRHYDHSSISILDSLSLWQSQRLADDLLAVILPMGTTMGHEVAMAEAREPSLPDDAALSLYSEEKKCDDSVTATTPPVGEAPSDKGMPTSSSSSSDDSAVEESLRSGRGEADEALFVFLLDWMSCWDSARHVRPNTYPSHSLVPRATSFPFAALLKTVLYGLNTEQPTNVVELATSLLWHSAVAIPVVVAANPIAWKRIEAVLNPLIQTNETDPDGGSDKIMRNLSAVLGTLVASISTTADTADDNSESTIQVAVATVSSQTWLVPSLMNMLQKQQQQGSPKPSAANANASRDVRRRSMRTIRCLAMTDWGCVMLLSVGEINEAGATVSSPLGPILVNALRHGTTDDVDTRILACRTMMDLWPKCVTTSNGANVTSSIPACSNRAAAKSAMIALGPSLETTLMQIVENADEVYDAESADKLVLAATQTLTVCLRHSPWTRSAQCFSSALLEQILAVLSERVDQPSYLVGFSEFFMELVRLDGNIPSTTEAATRIQGITKLLASNPSFLETAAILLAPLSFGPDYDVPRKNAIKVLSTVVYDNDGNKKPMAADENLLSALVNVCLMANNNEQLKDDTKQLIFQLVPEL